jgi:hypothetical protein
VRAQHLGRYAGDLLRPSDVDPAKLRAPAGLNSGCDDRLTPILVASAPSPLVPPETTATEPVSPNIWFK